MVKILGHWDIGHHAPITEQYYWFFGVRDFGITDWNMAPVSGIRNREHEVKLTEWDCYDSYFDANPDCVRVFVEPRTRHENPETVWLHDFEHPENCTYVFGAVGYNPTKRYRRDSDHLITVKTEQDKGVMWACQIMPIVLYDRMMKNGCYSNR